MNCHNMKSVTNNKDQGFALLMTLIVVGVVISVGLSMLDLALKQVRLSSNAKDSEIAFHATNAGVECAQYWRLKEKDKMEKGDTVNNVSCFGAPGVNVSPLGASLVIGGGNANKDAYLYSYEFEWGSANDRCTKISTLVASSSVANPLALEITDTDMRSMFLGYPVTGNFTCDPGSQCTVVSIKGYNKPCGSIGGYGVVEREVLLQY